MGYNFKRYCKDYQNIENYEAAKKDNFIGWECHHRLETHNSDGERRLVDITADELKALDMYYDRPSEELIFLTKSGHASLRKLSSETRKRLSDINKGRNNPFYGKHHTKENKKRISAASKGRRHTEEARKKMSDAAKGKPKTKEHKKKIAEAARINSMGRHWYNNGKENKFCYECPDGFVPGMLK